MMETKAKCQLVVRVRHEQSRQFSTQYYLCAFFSNLRDHLEEAFQRIISLMRHKQNAQPELACGDGFQHVYSHIEKEEI